MRSHIPRSNRHPYFNIVKLLGAYSSRAISPHSTCARRSYGTYNAKNKEFNGPFRCHLWQARHILEEPYNSSISSGSLSGRRGLA